MIASEDLRAGWIAFPLLAAVWTLVFARRGGWARAGGWAVLALLAQAASLELYEAGPRVSYHHYRPDGSKRDVAACALIVIQAALVTWGLRKHWTSVSSWIARASPGWRAPLVVVAMLVVASKPSNPLARSAIEFLFAATVQLVALGNVALIALSVPDDVLARFDRFAERVLGRASGVPEPGDTDRFALTVAVASFAFAALLNATVYERAPHVPDEVVYLLHARYLAAGKLWLSPPPVPEAFDVDLMLLDGGKWYCPVPIGWPMVLAVGSRLGVPWLVNPLIGGATVLVAYAFLRELTDRRGARAGIALLALSPWFVFLNMSFMTHSLTLFCALVAALGVARSRRTGSIAWCVVAGAALGVAALIRPLDGVMLSALMGLWAIGLGGARLRIPAIAALVLAAGVVGAATLPYNAALTGDPARFPIQRYVDVLWGQGRNDMGFGPEKGPVAEHAWGGLDPWPGHSLGEAVVTAQFNLFAVNAELFGWSCGSLLLIWLWFVRGRWSRTDRAMLAVAALVVASSLLYWFNGGPDFGARYWYLAIVPCVWLTLSGIAIAIRETGRPARARIVVVACAACALASWIPWRAIDKYWRYRGMSGEVRALAAQHRFGRSLVLVNGGIERGRHPDFAAAAAENPIDWEADAPIYAWDRNPAVRRALLEVYSDRPIWIVDGPSVTTSGRYELRSGPKPARELLEETK